MSDIKIRLNDPRIIETLDRIVSDEHYDSRNQLIVHILTLYCSSRDRFVISSLPSIVNSLCRESIDEISETSQKTLDIFIPLLAEVNKKLEKISLVIEELSK